MLARGRREALRNRRRTRRAVALAQEHRLFHGNHRVSHASVHPGNGSAVGDQRAVSRMSSWEHQRRVFAVTLRPTTFFLACTISTAWDDDKFRDKVIDFCAEWGYDSAIDWFEDNRLKVVDGNIVCEDCKGPVDLAGYPEHEVTCQVLYMEALENGVDPEEFYGDECQVPLAEDEEVEKSEKQLQLALDEFDKSEAKKKPKKGKK